MTTSTPMPRWRRGFRMFYQTTLKTGHGEPCRRPFALVQLQRSYGLQPRVARHELPWVQSVPLRTATRFWPALSRASVAVGRNRVAVVPSRGSSPRQALRGQPWAGGPQRLWRKERCPALASSHHGIGLFSMLFGISRLMQGKITGGTAGERGQACDAA